MFSIPRVGHFPGCFPLARPGRGARASACSTAILRVGTAILRVGIFLFLFGQSSKLQAGTYGCPQSAPRARRRLGLRAVRAARRLAPIGADWRRLRAVRAARRLAPFKGPRGPLKGPRSPFKGPRGPLKGPRGPFKGPRGPFKGPRGPFKGGLPPAGPPGLRFIPLVGSLPVEPS